MHLLLCFFCFDISFFFRYFNDVLQQSTAKWILTRIWADTQRHGRPAKYRWCPLLNTAKFGWCPLLECRAVTLPIWKNTTLGCTWQNSIRGQEPPKMYIYYSAADGQTSCKAWLASSEWRCCSNEAKMRNPLKFAGVSQTFAILLGYVEETGGIAV